MSRTGPGQQPKLSLFKLSEILDSIEPGLSINKTAAKADAAVSTVFNVLKDFPLWKFYKDGPDEEPEQED
jgi:hypothetical protein